MWYGNDEQLVRAPTPAAFDRLVQNLEDKDSVMFQSISVPAVRRSGARPATPREPAPAGRESASSLRSSASGLSATLSDDFDPIPEPEEIDILKRQIKAALERSAQKDMMIHERDARISDLQTQMAKLEGATEYEDPELIAYYKGQYEATAYQFEKLKEALAARGPASSRRRK
jgi:hypothetical protein